jgi:hypothetical protein
MGRLATDGPVSDLSATDKRRQRAHYLSQTAFAERVDISRVTLWRWIKSGRVRTIKLSPTVTRIHIGEIDRLAQESEHEQLPPRKRRKRRGAGQQDDDPQDDLAEEPD